MLDLDSRADTFFPMSYSRAKAEQVVTGYEPVLNEHLLKLMLLPAHGDAPHWREEATALLRRIERIRFKPNNGTGSQAWFYRILYLEPYEGSEIRNVRSYTATLAQDYKVPLPTDEDSAGQLHDRLQRFHQRLAASLAAGEIDLAAMLLPTL